jgi:putative hydrolase of the HAD superfamily
MTIRAVFFDMGGTIQTFSYTRELRLDATPALQERILSAGINLHLGNEELYKLISEGLARYHEWSIGSMQELPPQRVWRDYILAGYPVDLCILETHAEDWMVYLETCYYQRAMRPEAPEVLETIQRSGLKIGLISNVCSRSQVPNNLAEYGIAHFFNPIVLSSEYGRRKPDPAIFHYAARLANVPTSECLYVGDRVARDIVGARKAGYNLAIQIKNDFSHGETDEGAAPDAVIEELTELLDILNEANRRSTWKELVGPDGANRVRAILFDAGDILYYRPERGFRFGEFLQDLGLEANKRQTIEKEALVQQAYQGEISQDQYREAVLRMYGVSRPDSIERGMHILAQEDDEICFFDGVRQTLLELKQRGFLLGIITDTANPVSVKLSWFAQGGFEHVWDSIISSHEIGVRKPDPKIYAAALQQLGVTAKQVVFVGHKSSELAGAQAVGIRTVAFNYEKNAQADFYIQQFPELLKLPVIV